MENTPQISSKNLAQLAPPKPRTIEKKTDVEVKKRLEVGAKELFYKMASALFLEVVILIMKISILLQTINRASQYYPLKSKVVLSIVRKNRKKN